ncbi:hypothetical protein TDSAC_0378 [Thermodesulfobium acidiphilum]|uniref:Nucleotidyltransferase domain-containing protein n=1 Tax=Thermodesulfobium acidiphilum TaxID=1794699 RepID=A0A2R4VZ67_THEAF|nr:hypothetical protein [Thermodesulfobium acidiphilum]AWB09754.1 hypothetical protein TDSAC_0378 [Thermodesulfobium acidiphilum]
MAAGLIWRKKAGDIDILVVSEKIDFDVRRKIKLDLILAFGDRIKNTARGFELALAA